MIFFFPNSFFFVVINRRCIHGRGINLWQRMFSYPRPRRSTVKGKQRGDWLREFAYSYLDAIALVASVVYLCGTILILT